MTAETVKRVRRYRRAGTISHVAITLASLGGLATKDHFSTEARLKVLEDADKAREARLKETEQRLTLAEQRITRIDGEIYTKLDRVSTDVSYIKGKLDEADRHKGS